VPANYVLTHHGFFDPSCVVSLLSDEILGADLVVRGRDGAEHARFSPCAYPQFSLTGSPIAAGASTRPLSVHQPHAATYDGWIVSYGYDGKVVSGVSLSTQWVVPLPPSNVSDQDIAFFNDIETTAGGEDILQPVLDFSEIPGHWAIESEHCCISGIDEQSTLVEVTPGDVILGVVTSTGCDATGVCASWTVTTTDVTTGKSTVLNTTSPMGVPNRVNPGALETYGVTTCDMFPASGQETFIDNTLTEPDGGVETLRYALDELSGSPASVPTCGYGGSTSGSSYTLIFSTSPMEADAGASVDGGSSDASVDGSSDASLEGSTAVPPDAANEDSPGGGVDASVDSAPIAFGDASETDSGGAADGGLQVLPPGDSGSGDGGGTSLVGSSATDSSGSSGCGCVLAGVNGNGSVGIAPFSLLLLIGARLIVPRRKPSRTRRAAGGRVDPSRWPPGGASPLRRETGEAGRRQGRDRAACGR
jgi:hypothetical protein